MSGYPKLSLTEKQPFVLDDGVGLSGGTTLEGVNNSNTEEEVPSEVGKRADFHLLRPPRGSLTRFSRARRCHPIDSSG